MALQIVRDIMRAFLRVCVCIWDKAWAEKHLRTFFAVLLNWWVVDGDEDDFGVKYS